MIGKGVRTVSLALAAAMMCAGGSAAQESDMGSWQVRVRGIGVTPAESATISVINGDVEVDNSWVPELDISYFLADNWAVELILATTKHSAVAVGTDLGAVDLGSVWLLPPVLALQFHPLPGEQFRPYVGAGVNYTIFYNDEVPGDVVTDIAYDNAFGLAVQAGLDVALTGNWFLNTDLKKVFLSTDVALNDAAINAAVDLHPWVVGFGFGYRMGG